MCYLETKLTTDPPAVQRTRSEWQHHVPPIGGVVIKDGFNIKIHVVIRPTHLWQSRSYPEPPSKISISRVRRLRLYLSEIRRPGQRNKLGTQQQEGYDTNGLGRRRGDRDAMGGE